AHTDRAPLPPPTREKTCLARRALLIFARLSRFAGLRFAVLRLVAAHDHARPDRQRAVRFLDLLRQVLRLKVAVNRQQDRRLNLPAVLREIALALLALRSAYFGQVSLCLLALLRHWLLSG